MEGGQDQRQVILQRQEGNQSERSHDKVQGAKKGLTKIQKLAQEQLKKYKPQKELLLYTFPQQFGQYKKIQTLNKKDQIRMSLKLAQDFKQHCKLNKVNYTPIRHFLRKGGRKLLNKLTLKCTEDHNFICSAFLRYEIDQQQKKFILKQHQDCHVHLPVDIKCADKKRLIKKLRYSAKITTNKSKLGIQKKADSIKQNQLLMFNNPNEATGKNDGPSSNLRKRSNQKNKQLINQRAIQTKK